MMATQFQLFYRVLLFVFLVALSLTITLADGSPLLSQRSYSEDNNPSYGPWQDGKDLGEISFTLSESVPQTSKNWFITGLKLLHAFEYPEARAAFNKAQQTDTGQTFIMAIWGELMCSYQILWYSRQFDEAVSLLTRLDHALNKYEGTLNDSETVLIEATKKLFSIVGRDLLPSQSGSNIQEFYLHLDAALAADDSLAAEVKVFHLLSRLATRNGVWDISRNSEVITAIRKLLAEDETSHHPGLHHYLIHAAESPQLAQNRIRDVYPSVAWLHGQNTDPKNTSSIHLTHMPAHFYFAWGDWLNVAEINLRAWNKSLQRKTDLNNIGNIPPLTDASLALHEHLWRVYALLQKGLWDDAWTESEALYRRLTILQSSGLPPSELASIKNYYAYEKAYLLLELPEGHRGISILAERTLDEAGMSPWGLMANRFIKAWLALQQHDFNAAAEARSEFADTRHAFGFYLYPPNMDALPIMEQQLLAEESRQKGYIHNAIQIINKVTNSYDRMHWGHGVPITVKPIYEYLGELYLVKNALMFSLPVPNIKPVLNDQTAKQVVYIPPYDRENAMMAFQNELRYLPRRRQTLRGMLTASADSPEQHSKIQAKIDSLVKPLDYDALVTPPPCQASSSENPLIYGLLFVFPVLIVCLKNIEIPNEDIAF